MTKSEAINVVLGIAEEEIGYLERKITVSLTARLEMPDQQTIQNIERYKTILSGAALVRSVYLLVFHESFWSG